MELRRSIKGIVATAATLTVVVAAAPQPAAATPTGQAEYTVLAADNVASADAEAAIVRAGGTVLARNADVGMFTVTGPDTGFVDRVNGSAKLAGAARRTVIGHAPQDKASTVEQEAAIAAAAAAPTAAAATAASVAAGMDPLDSKLWGLSMVHADQSRRIEPGDRRVSVGILDTGVDASHPDIAPNFDWARSRNFAPDLPVIDGPCEVASCLDPVGTDDGGHGTHVAGTIGAAANGLGVSGIAPKVNLVELKGGQDSGFFFLEPVVNALTYAGRAGVDVVNMSFFVDPWLFNCTNNPADSPAQQAEQRTIIAAMTRALRFAHLRGVTLVAAAGNDHQDLGSPLPDSISPDFPIGTNYTRTIDNATCLDLPTEGPHVIAVSALGPSTKKADYSSYGTEQVSVSAPGGWFRDGFGTPTFRTDANEILSTYPLKVLQAAGRVDAAGNITPGNETLVFKDCTPAGVCGYYFYLQGTSMASPHAAGVAALIVSRFGHFDLFHWGTLTLNPDVVEFRLLHTAAEHACPDPRLQTYTNEGRPVEFNALCSGGLQFNGFYGFGIVDALAAVTH